MKRIYTWLRNRLLKHRLRKAQRFIEENCLERIRQGRVFHASEEAIEDWCNINNALHDILKASLSRQNAESHI